CELHTKVSEEIVACHDDSGFNFNLRLRAIQGIDHLLDRLDVLGQVGHDNAIGSRVNFNSAPFTEAGCFFCNYTTPPTPPPAPPLSPPLPPPSRASSATSGRLLTGSSKRSGSPCVFQVSYPGLQWLCVVLVLRKLGLQPLLLTDCVESRDPNDPAPVLADPTEPIGPQHRFHNLVPRHLGYLKLDRNGLDRCVHDEIDAVLLRYEPEHIPDANAGTQVKAYRPADIFRVAQDRLLLLTRTSIRSLPGSGIRNAVRAGYDCGLQPGETLIRLGRIDRRLYLVGQW